jgi:hypothetical protein
VNAAISKHANQTVFGEGPIEARVVLVGEQPGDQEDIADKPFVGPAGSGGLVDDRWKRCLQGLLAFEVIVAGALGGFIIGTVTVLRPSNKWLVSVSAACRSPCAIHPWHAI